MKSLKATELELKNVTVQVEGEGELASDKPGNRKSQKKVRQNSPTSAGTLPLVWTAFGKRGLISVLSVRP